MKLLGVELVNFASLDRQYVPLQTGINLLVGKNNAGKTAILKGLTLLASLPFVKSKPESPIESMGGYCRPGIPFGFEVLTQLEEKDSSSSAFETQDGRMLNLLQDELRSGRALARWRFSGQPNEAAQFQDCIFEFPARGGYPDRKGVVLKKGSNSETFFLTPLNYPNFHSGSARPGSNRLSASPIWPSLDEISKVTFVGPHRVVYNRQSLQTVVILPSNAQNLGPYLQTLQGQDRDTFDRIEDFMTKVFPEFRQLNPTSLENNQVAIFLKEKGTARRIPLENCGTGVEQVISLATFVLTTPRHGLVLLDEPHSYLHPTAERVLVQFLKDNPEHTYVVSTHSAVIMNSVSADRITYISPPGRAFSWGPEIVSVSAALLDLGYRNSDALFYDQLIFVEGKSDSEIIPILLEKDGEIDAATLNRTGFPILEGVGRGSTALQTSIHRYERLLSAIGRSDQSRIYLFDSDRRDDEQSTLAGTKNPATLGTLTIRFLARLELENYLLVPEAIAPALMEEKGLAGTTLDVSVESIKEHLNRILQADDQRLFPLGRLNSDPMKDAKGSLILEEIYSEFQLPYNKQRSGLLIAKNITAMNQPALGELMDLVRYVFSPAATWPQNAAK